MPYGIKYPSESPTAVGVSALVAASSKDLVPLDINDTVTQSNSDFPKFTTDSFLINNTYSEPTMFEHSSHILSSRKLAATFSQGESQKHREQRKLLH